MLNVRKIFFDETKKRAMDTYYDDYFSEIKDNLNGEMAPEHWDQYRKGSGGETRPGKKGSGGEIRPPKMACVYSSSAMAFNMLGNEKVTFIENPHFAHGEYKIEYEKKLKILKQSNGMSNIDVFLFNKDREEAIFCEMKMREWLNSPKKRLKEAYGNEENYCDGACEVFLALIKDLQREKEQKDSQIKNYDVWQMFIHTLAIFKAFADGGKLKADKKCKKITLANVVYKIEDWAPTDESDFKKTFEKWFEKEQKGFKRFHEIIFAQKSGLKDLFKNECGVDFNIVFITAHEFIDCMEKTNSEKKCLERYW